MCVLPFFLPQGVMLSHDNLFWNANIVPHLYKLNEVSMSRCIECVCSWLNITIICRLIGIVITKWNNVVNARQPHT